MKVHAVKSTREPDGTITRNIILDAKSAESAKKFVKRMVANKRMADSVMPLRGNFKTCPVPYSWDDFVIEEEEGE